MNMSVYCVDKSAAQNNSIFQTYKVKSRNIIQLSGRSIIPINSRFWGASINEEASGGQFNQMKASDIGSHGLICFVVFFSQQNIQRKFNQIMANIIGIPINFN